MKKLKLLGVVVFFSVLISCQKDYVCYCTKVNSGISIYKETYKGTIFAKKSAKKSCEKNMNIQTDTLTNCVIK